MRRPLLPALLAVGAILGAGIAVGGFPSSPSSADPSTATLESSTLTPMDTLEVSGIRTAGGTIVASIVNDALVPPVFFALGDGEASSPYCVNDLASDADLSWSCSLPLTDLPEGFARLSTEWRFDATEFPSGPGFAPTAELPFTVTLPTPTVTSVSPNPLYRSSPLTITGTKGAGSGVAVNVFQTGGEVSTNIRDFCPDAIINLGEGFAGTPGSTWSCTTPGPLPFGDLSETGVGTVLFSQRYFSNLGLDIAELSQPPGNAVITFLDDRPVPITQFDGVSTVVDLLLPEPLAGEDPFSGVIALSGLSDGAGPALECPAPCSLGFLEPGLWGMTSTTERNGIISAPVENLVPIPAPPTIVSVFVNGDNTVTISVSAEPGAQVTVRPQDGPPVCTVTTQTDGTFSCTTEPLAAASYRFTGTAVQSEPTIPPVFEGIPVLPGVTSAASTPSEEVTIAAPPAPEPPTAESPTTPPPPAPNPPSPELPTVSPPTTPEQPTTAPPTAPEQSAPTPPTGDAVTPSPAEVPPPGDGSDLPTAAANDPALEPDAEPAPETDEPVAQEEESPAVAAPAPPASNGTEASTAGRDDLAAPSAFTAALPTLWNILDEPYLVAAAFGFALLVMLLLAVPSEMLTSTLASSEHRLGGGYRRAQALFAAAAARFAALIRSGAARIALMLGAMAVIFSFADPDYGFDVVSLRLTASIALSLFLLYYLGARITQAIVQRAWGLPGAVQALPTALLLAVIGVIVARLIDFSPGFLIGLALGFSVLVETTARDRMRVALVTVGVTFAVAMTAWASYSLLTSIPGVVDTVAGVFAIDTLVAVTAEGLTGLVIVLLPLTFFDGHAIWQHAKKTWVAAYLVAVTAFVALVLPASFDEFGAVGELVGWIIPVVVFGVITLSLWWWLRREPSADTRADEEATQRAPAGR